MTKMTIICRKQITPTTHRLDGITRSLKTLSLATIGTLLLACSTPYQPMSFTGGYEEAEIEKDIFQVEFRGNAHTSLTTIAGYWHQRTKEICKARGKVPQVIHVKSEDKLTSFHGGNLEYKPLQIGHIRCVPATAGQAGEDGFNTQANTDVFPVLMPPIISSNVKRIAVLSLSESFGTGVPAQLDYTLAFIRGLRPEIVFVERESLEKVTDELKLQHSGRVDDETSKRIGKMVGADTLLLYRIVPHDTARASLVRSDGGAVSGGIEVQLIEVETGTSLFRQTVMAKTIFPLPNRGASWTEEGVIRAHAIASEKAATYGFSALAASLGVNPLGIVPFAEVGQIMDVLSASPAEAAGLKGGDKMISVNSQQYRSWTDRSRFHGSRKGLRVFRSHPSR